MRMLCADIYFIWLCFLTLFTFTAFRNIHKKHKQPDKTQKATLHTTIIF